MKKSFSYKLQNIVILGTYYILKWKYNFRVLDGMQGQERHKGLFSCPYFY